MAGTTQYKNQWQAENKERVSLVVPKGFKDTVRNAAAKKGESLNGYIIEAINRRMKEDESI